MAEEKKIATGYIGNALRSAADNHTTTFADEIFDTERQKYQNEVTDDLEQSIAEEKAAIMGTDRIADGAVTTEKLADNVVTISKIAQDAIDKKPTLHSYNMVSSDGVAAALAKISEISEEVVDDDVETIEIQDNDNNSIIQITPEAVDAKNLKSNGKNVATEEDISVLATKEEVAQKINNITIEEISKEVIDVDDTVIIITTNNDKPVSEIRAEITDGDEEIQSWNSDDYDDNGHGEQYVKITPDGISAKGFFDLDGNHIGGDKINILMFGNSFTQDSTSYMPFILKEIAPNVKLNVGMVFYGTASLADYSTFFDNNTKLEYRKYVDNATEWIKQSKNVDAILTDEKWDVVTFQQGSRQAHLDWNTYFAPYIYKLHRHVSDKVQGTVKFGWLLTHATGTTVELSYDTWKKISDNSKKVNRDTATSVLFPYGTAIETLRRASFGNIGDSGNLLADGTHLHEGIATLCASYVQTITVLKMIGCDYKGIIGSKIRPDIEWVNSHKIPYPNPRDENNLATSVIGITEDNVFVAQIAAIAAVNHPDVVLDIDNIIKGFPSDILDDISLEDLIEVKKEDFYVDVPHSILDYGVTRTGAQGSSALYKRTEIEVHAGEKYLLSGASYWNYPFYIFKTGDVVTNYYPIEIVKDIVLENNVNFVAPTDGTLIINTNLDDTNVEDGTSIRKFDHSISKSVLKNKVIEKENLSDELLSFIGTLSSSSPLIGKRIYNDGDSVARGAGVGDSHMMSYAEQIAAAYNMTLNHSATSGSCLSPAIRETQSIPDRMIENLTANKDYDYILFQGGFNDRGAGEDVWGNVSESYDATTFNRNTSIGNLEYLLWWMSANVPDIKKLFVLAHDAWIRKGEDVWEHYAIQEELWNRIEKTLKKWHVPYVDMYHESQCFCVNDTNASQWFLISSTTGVGDGLHPNTEAYTKFYLNKVAKALESL